MDPNLRNLKDFLTLYNKVTELCFTRCVDSLNERDLAPHEETCVNRCVNKFAAFNQNMMKVYVEVQSDINEKRMKELEEGQQLIQQNQQQTNTTTAASDVTTTSLSGTSKLVA